MPISVRHSALVLGLTALAACGGPGPDRFSVAPPEVAQSVRIAYGSVLLRDVSLPAYAASDEIHVRTETGALTSSSELLWSDSPERAVTLGLARDLARLTGARVASEPWPFEMRPAATLEVRMEDLVATTDGSFRATGQYFVGTETGVRERAGLFDLSVPYDPAAGPAAIAAARGQLILDLATLIAREALR